MASHKTEALLQAVDALGSPTEWSVPVGYPASLALCVLDSIWSLGVNYDRHVLPVLAAYRQLRRARGADPEIDTSSDLRAAVEDAGGPEEFARIVGSRHRTSSGTGSVLKAEAVHRAATMLAQHGVETVPDLQRSIETVRPAWREIPGQRSSATGWRYLLILANVPEVKPDRMVQRFVARALGLSRISPDAAGKLLRLVADERHLDLRALDHRIWLQESGRLRVSDM